MKVLTVYQKFVLELLIAILYRLTTNKYAGNYTAGESKHLKLAEKAQIFVKEN